MRAYDAMSDILDINECLENIKQRNSDTVPNQLDCKIYDLLSHYRTVLIAELKATKLEAFNVNREDTV